MYAEPEAGQDRGKLVLVAALVLVGIAALWFLTQQEGGEIKNVKIRVFAGANPFANASVTLVDAENKTVASGVLNADGEITFASLPPATYRVLISSDGKVRASQFIDLTKGRNSFSLRVPEGAAFKYYKGGFRIEALDADTKKPIEGARITYENGRDSGLLIAGTDGAAIIPVNYEDLVRVKTMADGYAEESAAFLASPAGASLYLKKASVVAQEGGAAFAAPETTSIEISIWTDDSGTASGIVRAYECSTNALLSSTPVGEAGIADIYNVSAGSSVYINVEADGYVAWSGTCESIYEGKNSFDVHLNAKTADNSAEETLRVADENGNLTSADVVILSPPRTIYKKFSCSGECLLDLPSKSVFYVSVSAESRVPAVSDFFVSGENVNIIIPKATKENSAVLTVTVKDEGSGRPVEGALTAIYDSDGLYLGDARKTDAEGKARFGPLLKERVYEADAAYFEAIASSYADLPADAEVVLEMDAFGGTLNLTAVALDTGRGLPALFTVKQGTDEQSCRAPCVMRVNAFAEARITAEANGYLDYSASETLEPREKKSHEAALIPLGSNISRSETFLRFDGLYETNGSKTTKIYANGTYRARFFLSPAEGSNASGIALRVGDEGNVSGFGISGYTPSPSQAEKSGWYEPTATGICTDLSPDRTKPQQGLLKWVALQFDGAGSKTITFTIKAGRNGSAEEELRLYYRAYSDKNGKLLRIPSDDELGDAENVETKAGCYAYSESAIYKIERAAAAKPSPTPSPSPSPSPSPTPAQFTSNGTVWLEGGRIRTDFEEIRMQADSILPGDALPLNMSGGADCEIQYAIRGLDEKCFNYDGEKAMLIFKAKELDTTCGISATGNTTKPDAKMVFSSACVSGATEVPIIVDFAESESAFVEPFSVTPGDSTAKLFYLISEMQAERRMKADYTEAIAINVTGNASANATNATKSTTGNIFFEEAGAKAAAWAGPDKITITEGNETLREYNYEKLASYFQNVGTVGGASADACDDFLCCARGWCDAAQFGKAFDDFSAKAQDAARLSAFRRGAGEPLKSLTGKPFRYVMVAQLREGALGALETNGITLNAENCSTALPAIVEIAATSDGSGPLNYSGRVLSVDESFGASGDKMCGFVQADGTSVKTTDHATLASMTQAATPAPIQATSSFDDGMLSQCKTADERYRNSQKAVQLAAVAMNNKCGSGIIPQIGGGGSAQGAGQQVKTDMKTCASPAGAPGACGGVKAAADGLAGTYSSFKQCLASGSTAEMCYAQMSPEVSTAVTAATTCVSGYHEECVAYCGDPPAIGCTKTTTCETACSPAAQQCAAAMGAFEAALQTMAQFGQQCDTINGFTWEKMGSLPPRSAWYTCYAYDVGCKIRCQEKPAYVEAAAFGNQLFYVTRTGLEKNCVPRAPATLGSDINASSAAMQALEGRMGNCAFQNAQEKLSSVNQVYGYYAQLNNLYDNSFGKITTNIDKAFTNKYSGFVLDAVGLSFVKSAWDGVEGSLSGVKGVFDQMKQFTGYDEVSGVMGSVNGLANAGFTASDMFAGKCEMKAENTGAVYAAVRAMTQSLPATAVGTDYLYDYMSKYAGTSATQSGFLGWLDAAENPLAGGGNGAPGIVEIPAKGSEDSAVYPDETAAAQDGGENAIMR
ncbi:Carboxypeptidase regulatory-like domain protein [Candidatus Norongarragalina meridionalis]|nr:Carboxypeptidase regulatory-like domain protein [Candidatus Norongarragalina meridionalis]